MMLKHVYQKSISEILSKILTPDSDFDEELTANIKTKQKFAITCLIDGLGPDFGDEQNMNCCTILLDMIETKEFFNIICLNENIKKIVNFSISAIDKSTKSSKNSSLTVLNKITQNLITSQKVKEQKGEDKTESKNEDEDDMINMKENSEDEGNEDLEATNPNSVVFQTNSLVEYLIEKIHDIEEVLLATHQGEKVKISVSDTEFVPLGTQRLQTVELVSKMIQLRKEILFTEIGRTKIFFNIIELVKTYQWNNFLQLKVINLFEHVINNCENQQFRKDVLSNSGIAYSLQEMSKDAIYQMESERNIRNGHMALVVSISNMLIKQQETEKGAAGTAGEELFDAEEAQK